MDKRLIVIIVTIACIMLLFLIGYDFDQKRKLKPIAIDKLEDQVNSTNKLNYNIESNEISNGTCIIKGWSFIKNKDTKNVKFQVVLKNNEGKLFKVNSVIVQRTDITQSENDKHNYNNCGFESLFNIKDMQKDNKYKIGIEMKIDNCTYFVWTKNEIDL